MAIPRAQTFPSSASFLTTVLSANLPQDVAQGDPNGAHLRNFVSSFVDLRTQNAMPQILDAAIGTIFVFLLFSFVISAAGEVILSALDCRAKFFQVGLNELLSSIAPGTASNPEAKADGRFNTFRRWTWRLVAAASRMFRVAVPENAWVEKFCRHGLINAFSKTNGTNHPSYLPGGAFVTGLFDLLLRGSLQTPDTNLNYKAPDPGKPLAIADVIAAMKALPECHLKESLLSLISTSGQDLESFKAAVEGWYNAAMDRVKGWYKRFAQKWMILIGFIVAAAINVDTIHIVQVLANNPNLAKAVASQATTFVQEHPAIPAAGQAAGDPKSLTEAREEFHRSVKTLSSTGIPIGWSEDQLEALDLKGKELNIHNFWDWISEHRGQVFLLVVGWLLTALAGSLGAPFWFDLLSRFVLVRNSGNPPGDKDPTQPDNVPPAPPSFLRTPVTR